METLTIVKHTVGVARWCLVNQINGGNISGETMTKTRKNETLEVENGDDSIDGGHLDDDETLNRAESRDRTCFRSY